jgi:hypothetical protein
MISNNRSRPIDPDVRIGDVHLNVVGSGVLQRRIAGLLRFPTCAMNTAGHAAAHWAWLPVAVAGAILVASRCLACAPPDYAGAPADAEPSAATGHTVQKPAGKSLTEDEERDIKARQWGLRNRRVFQADPFEGSLIGGLVESDWWRSQLPLAPEQAKTITQLDELIRNANDDAARAAADSLDTNPAHYQRTLATLEIRLSETIRAGERMVWLGLLTEAQAAFVQYRYASGGNHLYVLQNKNIQDVLGLTEDQVKQLEKVGREASRRLPHFRKFFTTDLKEAELLQNQVAANTKQMNDEALSVLTPSQRTIWDWLTARRSLPARAPEMPAPSKDETSRIKLGDVSPVLGVLNAKADAFKLSDAQRKLLDRLEEITGVGLYWISLRKSQDGAPVVGDQVAKASAAFVKEAEQIALSGILTEKQAEQVKSGIK